ncbi:fumarylacetoacetate hydrolase family protein [Streptomyces canus]|uniref:fumarylacetoacetate hydrolase family protein n=1 Tax=Streptomyces canus TaxID=58343 RepID=UPI002DD8D2AF|nr:fumarylacetoacetate hydrolase family protein [Streptomyces canus]WSD83607.1 fumarylacetoacetate hydrolase family protein [Streptomyces canus]
MTRLVSTVKGVGRLEDDGESIAFLDVDTTDLGTALQAGLDMPTRQVQLLAPVPRPSKIWAVGYAYADHRTEVDHKGVAEEPVVFLKAPSSVIGRRAADVSEAEAYACVAGFTIVNDVSAAKNLDTFTPMGPALVTLDEFTDPDDLRPGRTHLTEGRHSSRRNGALTTRFRQATEDMTT